MNLRANPWLNESSKLVFSLVIWISCGYIICGLLSSIAQESITAENNVTERRLGAIATVTPGPLVAWPEMRSFGRAAGGINVSYKEVGLEPGTAQDLGWGKNGGRASVSTGSSHLLSTSKAHGTVRRERWPSQSNTSVCRSEFITRTCGSNEGLRPSW